MTNLEYTLEDKDGGAVIGSSTMFDPTTGEAECLFYIETEGETVTLALTRLQFLKLTRKVNKLYERTFSRL